MELLEANVSPVANTAAWEANVQSLRQDEAEASAPLQDAIDDAMDVAGMSA